MLEKCCGVSFGYGCSASIRNLFESFLLHRRFYRLFRSILRDRLKQPLILVRLKLPDDNESDRSRHQILEGSWGERTREKRCCERTSKARPISLLKEKKGERRQIERPPEWKTHMFIYAKERKSDDIIRDDITLYKDNKGKISPRTREKTQQRRNTNRGRESTRVGCGCNSRPYTMKMCVRTHIRERERIFWERTKSFIYIC